VLSVRRAQDGLSATLAVRDITDEVIHAAALRLDAHIDSEGLGLEDIFLEIHA
jgi:hypothetical protein